MDDFSAATGDEGGRDVVDELRDLKLQLVLVGRHVHRGLQQEVCFYLFVGELTKPLRME